MKVRNMTSIKLFAFERAIKGLSLIEVLVALLVVGIGLLGVTGLELTAVKTTEDAFFRGQATEIAQDIVERMRVNTGQVVEYQRLFALPDEVPLTGCGSQCSPQAVAENDVAEIKQLAQTLLPGASVRVAACGVAVCARVAWNEVEPIQANCEDATDVDCEVIRAFID